MLDNIYLSGFVQRCAERGVNPDALIKQAGFIKNALSKELMLRAAKARMDRLVQRGYKGDLNNIINKMFANVPEPFNTKSLNKVFNDRPINSFGKLLAQGILNKDKALLEKGLKGFEILPEYSKDFARIATLPGRDLNMTLKRLARGRANTLSHQKSLNETINSLLA